MRRRAAQAYAMTSILVYEDKIQKLLDLNWTKLTELSDSKTIIDMEQWAQYFAYDVVSELALGRAFGMVKAGRDAGHYIDIVLGRFFWSSNLGHLPGQMNWLMNPFSRLLINLCGSNTMKGIDRYGKFMRDAVWDRYYSKTKPETFDMLQHFIDAKDRDGSSTSFGAVVKEAANVLGAGADTTSVGIRAILFQILSHPTVYTRIQGEIDGLYERELSEGSEITYKQCQTLPYLQAVIKEATRLHPSIVYQLPRYSPPEGLTIAGHHIPPGWPVGISALSMNRSKEIFGEDANEFNPERWLLDPTSARFMDSLLATVRFSSSGN
jgi:cytochrome P450